MVETVDKCGLTTTSLLLLLVLLLLGGVVVGRRTCDRQIASSTPGRCVAG